MKHFIIYLMVLISLTIYGNSSLAGSNPELEKEVVDTESAFAKTMADRDFEAFKSFISDEAVFWSGTTPLEGKDAVLAVWKAYYEGPDALFAWKPETVVVLETGDLAYSTGPVWGPDNVVNAYYNSIWRKNEKGEWKIVFDKGQPNCNP